ncbi:abdominal ganglion neuropeptide r3-14 [Plakobranchus ocellatus]|uniref:Abdominal ganglion neuropeptide r3-14 n=1 Tax=Plakobranchus ocellatus TaxID=259542 RepID=A0AAV4BC20_9GAST|nr:abdominal ganglion neuropeptide r3-14 [Plakobranchus ocellatus]
MEINRAVLLVCLIAVSLLAHCSLASPVLPGDSLTMIESAVSNLRARREANGMEPADAAYKNLLTRMRRSMAQIYTGNIHFNNHRRHNRNGLRRHRRRHRHHQRHGAGRVYEA